MSTRTTPADAVGSDRALRAGAVELAALISRLDIESETEVLAVRGPRVAADAICAADPDVSERVLRGMPDEAAEQIVAAMPVEHATRWRARIRHTPVLWGRRFIRSRVWPRRRHAPAGGRRTGPGAKP